MFSKLLPEIEKNSRKLFSKLLSQKIFFQNYCLKEEIFKKYIFKIAFSKDITPVTLICSSSESLELSSEEISKSSNNYFLLNIFELF